MTKTTVTTAVNGLFSPEVEASLKAAAASVAESDAGNDEALETFARVLGPAPTFEVYSNGQKVFQAGYIAAMPDMSLEALAKRTSRFFSELLKTYGMTKPQSHDPAAEKKREQRAKAEADLLAKHKNATPDKLKAEISKQAQELAKHPDNKEIDRRIKEAKKILRIITKADTDKLNEEIKGLRSSIAEAMKKTSDTAKLKAALEALK